MDPTDVVQADELQQPAESDISGAHATGDPDSRGMSGDNQHFVFATLGNRSVG